MEVRGRRARVSNSRGWRLETEVPDPEDWDSGKWSPRALEDRGCRARVSNSRGWRLESAVPDSEDRDSGKWRTESRRTEDVEPEAPVRGRGAGKYEWETSNIPHIIWIMDFSLTNQNELFLFQKKENLEWMLGI